MRFDIDARQSPRPYSEERYDECCADGSPALASKVRNLAHDALEKYAAIARDDPGLDWPRTCEAFAREALRILASSSVDPDAVRRMCLQFEMDTVRLNGVFDLQHLHDYLLAHVESGRRGLEPRAELEQIFSEYWHRRPRINGLPGADEQLRVSDETACELMSAGTLEDAYDLALPDLTSLVSAWQVDDAEAATAAEAEWRERCGPAEALTREALRAAQEGGHDDVASLFEEQLTVLGVLRRYLA